MSSERTGMQASVDGFAHEHIAAGILMKIFKNVSLVNLPLSPYDLIIVQKDEESESIIRAQVKTAKTSISFQGGTRGGVDRTYKSGVKTYTQSTITSDVVIGIKPLPDSAFDLYFIPTLLIEKLGQKSIAISRVEFSKNNYELLKNCKNRDFVLREARIHNLL
jgi:hypothetical protein